MIKIEKSLGLLAGSIILASSAHSAILQPSDLVQGNLCTSDITPCASHFGGFSTTSDVVFLLNNSTSQQTLIYNTGVTGDQLASGIPFSVDLAANASYAGFNADSWSLFGITSGTATYTTSGSSIALDGVGLVFASSNTDPSINFHALFFSVIELNDVIDRYNGNQIVSGSSTFPRLGASLAAGGLLNEPFAQANVFSLQGNGFNVSRAEPLFSLTYDPASNFLVGGPTATVPVPAATWLFLSGFFGLILYARQFSESNRSGSKTII